MAETPIKTLVFYCFYWLERQKLKCKRRHCNSPDTSRVSDAGRRLKLISIVQALSKSFLAKFVSGVGFSLVELGNNCLGINRLYGLKMPLSFRASSAGFRSSL